MATVHPSRMGLIPHEMRTTRQRSLSPPRRSRSRDRRRDDGGRDREKDRERERDKGDLGRRRHEDARDRGRDREREGHRADSGANRRASPAYEDYRRMPPPLPASSSAGEASSAPAPWRQQDSMYPGRRDHYGGGYGGAGGGADFMESRRLQRENQVASVWPPSPKEPARALSPKRSKSSKKSKRRRSPSSSSSSSDSEEERRRRERKERKRARRREKEERREKERDKKRSKRSRSRTPEHDRERRRHRSRTRSKSRTKSLPPASHSPSRSRSPSPRRMDLDVAPPAFTAPSSVLPPHDDDGEDVGPQPMAPPKGTRKVDERAYGGALLRGEGSAMAAFLSEGTDARIPRRGEIGLTSDQIATFEDVGYVMSGSRHRMMNAVRMRKENQVISAEEKRGILKLQKEERERREAILREEFSELVNEKLKATGSKSAPAETK